MKRLIPILLTLCLLLALTACSGEGSKPPIPAGTESGQKPVETKALKIKAPESQTPETQAPDPTIALTKGVISGDVYTNESLKLRFELPEGWTFYSEEQIAQANNMSAELFENTDVQDAISAAGQYMDLFASSANNLENINLIIQPANAVLNALTDQQIYENFEEAYRSQFASAGMEVKTYELLTARFCGEDKVVLHLEMSMSGVLMKEYQIWIRSNPNYTVVLTISSTTMEDPQSMFDRFAKLN